MKELRYTLVSSYQPNLHEQFVCEHCGKRSDHPRNVPGRRPRFCDNRCRQAAYRKRKNNG